MGTFRWIALLVILASVCCVCGDEKDLPTRLANDTILPTKVAEIPVIPATKHEKPGDGGTDEVRASLHIFFLLSILMFSIFTTHVLIKFKFHYVPESVAVVFIGVLMGLILKWSGKHLEDLEQFSPKTFFLVLLPPIIFESGYSLHKGNFFQNLGSILLFAVVGTAISAVVVGGGMYGLGLVGLVYKFTAIECFAFGSLISAVDPVATLAIFHALDVNPTLNMLVFGESVLNDAVSIVMTRTILNLGDSHGGVSAVLTAVWQFIVMFTLSAAIGVVFALASAFCLKHVNLRNTPALEFSMLLIFTYMPYGLSEALKLSGIMSVLFCGIVMSHYTHFNLSPVCQVNVQQAFRGVAFMAETCVFAYLGMAIFGFKHSFYPSLIIWIIFLCFVGRALNIFPLSALANLFRQVTIDRKMQCIMWFSGLRGAIAFALSLTLDQLSEEKRSVLVTTTLVIVLFTILILGSSTLPLLKYLNAKTDSLDDKFTLSKTEDQREAVDAEHLEENIPSISMRGFSQFDIEYLIPFFRRKFTPAEMLAGRHEMQLLTEKWYSGLTGHAEMGDVEEHSNLTSLPPVDDETSL